MTNLKDFFESSGSDALPDFTLDYVDSGYVTQNLEIAYKAGREAGPDDECPFEDPTACDEWNRGWNEAESSAVHSMSRGNAPDRWRDPGPL